MQHETRKDPERAREREWIKQRLKMEQNVIKSFTDSLKKFLEEGTPIEKITLKEALEATEFLLYTDKEGALDIGMTIHKMKKTLGIPDENDQFYLDMQSRAKNFGEAIFEASSWHAYFMRGPDGLLSDTVPLVFRKQMLEITLEEIKELAEFYKKKIRSDHRTDGYPHLDEPIRAITEKYALRYAQIQEEANPYIIADDKVALAHQDEYTRLQEELSRTGGEHLSMSEESADIVIRYFLTRLHQDEYDSHLKKAQRTHEKEKRKKQDEFIKKATEFYAKQNQ